MCYVVLNSALNRPNAHHQNEPEHIIIMSNKTEKRRMREERRRDDRQNHPPVRNHMNFHLKSIKTTTTFTGRSLLLFDIIKISLSPRRCRALMMFHYSVASLRTTLPSSSFWSTRVCTYMSAMWIIIKVKCLFFVRNLIQFLQLFLCFFCRVSRYRDMLFFYIISFRSAFHLRF